MCPDTEPTELATPLSVPPRPPAPAAAGGGSSPSETLSQLVGGLALPLWGLTALSVADETGLLDALSEPTRIDSLAASSGLSPCYAEAIGDVLVAIGVAVRKENSFTAVPMLAAALAGPARQTLRADLRSNLLQSAAFLADARCGTVPSSWKHVDPLILTAQGLRSASLITVWAEQLFPSLDGLVRRLEEIGGRFLDVGVGVAALAIALCRRYPRVTGVGIDPWEPALQQARRNVADAGLGSRIELRDDRFEDFEGESCYDLIHVPATFFSSKVLECGVDRAVVALRPGGWIVIQVLAQSGAELLPSVTRLWCVLWGSDPILPERVTEMLARAGYEQATIVRLEGGPPIAHVVARRPQR